jgi:hypothetical protein
MGRFVIQPSHFSRAIEMVQANRSKIWNSPEKIR